VFPWCGIPSSKSLDLWSTRGSANRGARFIYRARRILQSRWRDKIDSRTRMRMKYKRYAVSAYHNLDYEQEIPDIIPSRFARRSRAQRWRRKCAVCAFVHSSLLARSNDSGFPRNSAVKNSLCVKDFCFAVPRVCKSSELNGRAIQRAKRACKSVPKYSCAAAYRDRSFSLANVITRFHRDMPGARFKQPPNELRGINYGRLRSRDTSRITPRNGASSVVPMQFANPCASECGRPHCACASSVSS